MRFLKTASRMLIAFGVLYIVFVGILYVWQESMMYFPMKRGNASEKLLEKMPDFKEVSYYLPSGRKLYAWYRKAQKGKKTIVFFHGNAACAEMHAYHLNGFYEAGYGLLLPEYRGYGDLKGKPSQKSMEEDALTAVKYLNGLNLKNKDIILYGHSMGTYPAVYTAVLLGDKNPFNGVILEAPFQSALQVAKDMFGIFVPVEMLMKEHFATDQYIQRVKTRLFIAHGKKDDIIPYEQGYRLYQSAAQPKIFFGSEKADHLNLIQNGLDEALLNWAENKDVSGK